LIEEIHAGLVACGLPAERAVAAYRALWQFTIGELTIRDAGARVIPRADRPAVQTTTRTEVDPEVFPTLAAVADHWAAARGRDTYTEDLAALEWLPRAFDFEEKAVHRGEDGTIHHAELRLGAGMIMFGQHREGGWPGGTAPDPLASPLSLYIVVDDPDAHHDRAQAAGAEIVRELADMDYGSREYSARDLEGNLWSLRDLRPLHGGVARSRPSGARDRYIVSPGRTNWISGTMHAREVRSR
jgi:uncharacterized glyoxalase superfamily protein PhnB